MSHRHHGSEHRSCEAMASTSGLQENVVESTSNILSDTDSGVADTDETSNRRSSGVKLTGARPKSATVTSSETASTSSTSTSSSVDLHTLRDPSHYEELNVIGNGEFDVLFRKCQKIMGHPLKTTPNIRTSEGRTGKRRN